MIFDELVAIAGPANVLRDEPMNRHTSFRIGGPADFLVIARDKDALAKTLRLCRQYDLPVTFMGNGSNLLVLDNGIKGVVIKTKGGFDGFSFGCDEGGKGDEGNEGDVLEAESGTLLSKLSVAALDKGLSGLEFASGIPGTLGGAVYMNAGAYGSEMKDIVISTQYMDLEGNIHELDNEGHHFGSRTSVFESNRGMGIIISSRIKLKKADKAEIAALMEDYTRRRRQNQPLEVPSAGSVFKRPGGGHYVWKLIDGCGLRGFSIGGAQVSDKHCGFIINTGNASARDVTQLVCHIQECVRKSHGVELEPEIRIIGEP